ncbi:MAG: hypothetical protein EPO20_21260 [Betaproteobacteria bacterium]|nr:MAG: hypothetical protein EPO20_21260 [Betaproteobacteria bacterium]
MRAEIDALAVAKSARYLSMTSWYGHEEKLARISAEPFAKIDRLGAVDRDWQTAAFNLAQLSAATRYLIARRRMDYAKCVTPPPGDVF